LESLEQLGRVIERLAWLLGVGRTSEYEVALQAFAVQMEVVVAGAERYNRHNSTMSATETIIGFAAKQVVDRIVGGPASVVTAYHKLHFVVLARAIAESNRDAKIQNSLAELKKNINGLTEAGEQIVRAIPDPPVPPSSDLSFLVDRKKAATFQQQCDAYAKGVQAIITVLEDYIAKVSECVNTTEKQLRFIQDTKWLLRIRRKALTKSPDSVR
jgi:hypothetical protein